jgi:hypothetical protein
VGSEVRGSVWIRHHYKIVPGNVVAPLVEHKTALALSANQVHTGAAQFPGIHAVEVGGILEIYLHNAEFSANIHIIYYINERFPQNVKVLTHFV